MSRLAACCLAFSLPWSTMQANEPPPQIEPLALTCNIGFLRYDGIDQAAITRQAELTSHKQQHGGAVLLTQTEHYAFWVMAHSVQSLDGHRFINNFQVAIEHKASGLFMHALSDTSHHPSRPPLMARISLVDYYPDSKLEQGELFFECNNDTPIGAGKE